MKATPHLRVSACRGRYAPQPGGGDWVQLGGEGAGFRGLPGHRRGLRVPEERPVGRGPDFGRAQGAEFGELLLRLVVLRSEHGPQPQRSPPDQGGHHGQPLLLVRLRPCGPGVRLKLTCYANIFI